MRSLGGYEVLDRIAEGGMAAVFLARPEDGSRDFVALKIIRPELAGAAEFVTMFFDEARLAAKLSHPHIVEHVEFGSDGGRPFLATALLRGRTLRELFDLLAARGEALPYVLTAFVGARVADALHHAHELKDETGRSLEVVHRDLNPSNVFLTFDGRPYVIDFGLAKARGKLAVTAAGIVKGKLAYLSPEQAHGRPADRRTDVFALGITLWELSTGRRLFKMADDAETIRRAQAADVPDPRTFDPNYPEGLAAIVLRALARSPDDRFATALEMAAALDAFAEDSSGGATERGEAALSGFLKALFPSDRAKLPWEQTLEAYAASAPPPPRSAPVVVEAWDAQAERMTLMQAAVVAPSFSTQRRSDPSWSGLLDVNAPASERLAEVRTRIDARLASTDAGRDAVLVARAELERAVAEEVLGDTTASIEHAERALEAMPTLAAAHRLLRRLRHRRGAHEALLPHLDAEIAAAGSPGERADLLAERARLLTSGGADAKTRRAAYELALVADPTHAAALKGYEAALLDETAEQPTRGASNEASTTSLAEHVVDHLARAAAAYEGAPHLAAWLHVERAFWLDGPLGRRDAAFGAMQTALAIAAAPAVRAAAALLAAQHRDDTRRIELLEDEIASEADTGRRARLELEAATLALHRLHDAARAEELLERARVDASESPLVTRIVLDVLVPLHEARGRFADARRTRGERLRWLENGGASVRARARELAAMAAAAERAGDWERALEDVERARALDPADPALFAFHDRVLELLGRTEARRTLWLSVAARPSEKPEVRAAALARAAQLAETLGDAAGAAAHLRAAVTAAPGDLDAIEAFALLVTRAPAEKGRPNDATASRSDDADDVRARIAVYTLAAEQTHDASIRIGYLEKVAVLWEEVAEDPRLAAATYARILELEPARTSALLGLARAAARGGDLRAVAEAHVSLGELAGDGRDKRRYFLRAAEAYAPLDADRAVALTQRVLEGDPENLHALELETRLYETQGRFADVDRTLGRRIAIEREPPRKVALLLARAELRRTHLGQAEAALASLREARALAPEDASVDDAIVHLLTQVGDVRGLRDHFVALAGAQNDPLACARALLRAGEIEEHCLSDDEAAARSYARALEAAPNEALPLDRLLALLARRPAEEVEAYVARVEVACVLDVARRFSLALLLRARGASRSAESRQIDAVLEGEQRHVPALRALERIARASESRPMLANALSLQADAFADTAAKRGALWAEAELVEWTLPDAGSLEPFARIAREAPSDRAALDALLRRALARAREGDERARKAALGAVDALLALAKEPTTRLSLHLLGGLLLEQSVRAKSARDDAGALLSHAADHYRSALDIEPNAVVAATGLVRIAEHLGDAPAAVRGAVACAELAPSVEERALLLHRAAKVLLEDKDARLGSREARLRQAGALLERALEADPDHIAAAALLARTRGEDHERDRLLAAFETALARATTPDAVLTLGTEIARIAGETQTDRGRAIRALVRVRDAIPEHAATLVALGELYEREGVVAAAVDALEAATRCGDAATSLRAWSRLAAIYGREAGRDEDAERAERALLSLDPNHVPALESLLVRARKHAAADPTRLREVETLLARRAALSQGSERTATALLELADVRLALADREGAESALVEACAIAPTDAALERLHALYGESPGERVGLARTLGAIVARSEELGRPNVRTLTLLATLEAHVLGRAHDAVAHFRAAVMLAPQSNEARHGLAAALRQAGEHDEAIALLGEMVFRDPAGWALGDVRPTLAELEQTLAQARRADEAIVVRELRVLAGGVDDAAHVELRARRLGYREPLQTFDRSLLLETAFEGRAPALLDAAHAALGVEARVLRATLQDVGASPRDKVPSRSDHPLRAPFDRVVRLVKTEATERAELWVTDAVHVPRVIVQDVPHVLVPHALENLAEPVQTAVFARMLARATLGLTPLEETTLTNLHAYLAALARTALPSIAFEPSDGSHTNLVAEYERAIDKHIARRQRKQLAPLAGALDAIGRITLADVEAVVLGALRAEVRLAFIATGDLLATLDVVRFGDPDLARALASNDTRALASALAHPVAGDLIRFAQGRSATTARFQASTLWSSGRPSR
jgi:Tfp pilus assembly protein PilF